MTDQLPRENLENSPEGSEQSAIEPTSGALSATALILSFLVPIAGLVVALIARSAARRSGRQTDGMARAALVISSIFIGLGVLAAIGSLIFVLVVAGQVAKVTNVSVPKITSNEVAVKVTSAGTIIDSGDLLSAATQVTTHRLQRASVQFSSFGANAQGLLVVKFPDSSSAKEMKAAASAVAVPTDAGFRKVLGSGDPAADGSTSFASAPEVTQAVATEFSHASCKSVAASTEGVIKLDGGLFISCDADLTTKYLVGEVLVPGTSISNYTASSTGVHLELNSDGTQRWATLSSDLAGHTFPDNQVALVIGNEVVLAPTVSQVVTDGQLTISTADQSHFDPALVESQLALAAHNVSFSIDGIQTKM